MTTRMPVPNAAVGAADAATGNHPAPIATIPATASASVTQPPSHPKPWIWPTASRLPWPLRASWLALWWGTALVSLWGWGGPSHDLLAQGGVSDAALAAVLIAAGVALDLAVGAWLLCWPGRWACAVALGCVLLLTLLATAMTPGQWLHPYGPLLKNLPLAASLLWGWQTETPMEARRS